MWSTSVNKKRFFIVITLTSVASFSTIFVSCSILSKYDFSPYIGKDEVILPNKKIVKYTALNSSFFSYFNKNDNDFLKADYKNDKKLATETELVNNVDKLKSITNSWQKNYSDYLTSKQHFRSDNSVNMDGLKYHIKKLEEVYTSKWFEKNSLVIDYGGHKKAKLKSDSNDFFMEKTEIENLMDISLVKHTDNLKDIEIIYKKDEEQDNSRYESPIIYELENKTFGLSSKENYSVFKLWNTDTKVLKRKREFNANSYLNTDLHYYNEDWQKEITDDNVSFYGKSKLLKSKLEFDNLILKSKSPFLKMNPDQQKNIGEFDKVISYYDDKFFKDNFLAIASVSLWTSLIHEENSPYIDDYNVLVKNNEVAIILFTNFVRTDIATSKKPELVFSSSLNKFENIPIKLSFPSEDATLFIPISKSKLSDTEKARIQIYEYRK
ncbi:hypothetical protein CJJ23_00475 [Mycoplasmopsis agassizii]|uniref:Uncharacterized protein n=1 Tax=Mycoplasmopsis agassizii TaxID=33922 RepID=A0A269TKC3_9BACT|nr:hypothetical protein [Mycoplasmopsis agassizii]PAK21807.1 hypothetical protein CJJ23_00475 [Mycoplasmopsis agassizii]